MHEIDRYFHGTLRKIQITSINSYFGPMPEDGDVEMQRLTILVDGRVWLSEYCYGADYRRGLLREKRQLRISKDAADKIIEAFTAAFGQRYKERYPATDAPWWELTLTNMDGHGFQTVGMMSDESKMAVKLSELIRKALRRDDLLVLDGKPLM